MKEYKYKINGNPYTVRVNGVEDNIAHVEVNGTPYNVELDKPAKKQIRPLTRPQAAPTTVAGAPVVSRPTSGATGAILSPLPGVILEVTVKVGDTVKRGQKVAVLEAMKMENAINAGSDGKVAAVKINKGDSVLEGAELIIIE